MAATIPPPPQKKFGEPKSGVKDGPYIFLSSLYITQRCTVRTWKDIISEPGVCLTSAAWFTSSVVYTHFAWPHLSTYSRKWFVLRRNACEKSRPFWFSIMHNVRPSSLIDTCNDSNISHTNLKVLYQPVLEYLTQSNMNIFLCAFLNRKANSKKPIFMM